MRSFMKLWVTVYEKDDEAADIWLNEIQVDSARFGRIGAKDNFWSMGDTGPCGPCSEIFYDHGEHIPGGPPGSPDEDADRFVEIWNLVFMQFDQRGPGDRLDLPRPSIDTGMGLERIAAVLQGVHDNYDTDGLRVLIEASAEASGARADGEHAVAHRVIADHLRACSFLMADGVLPSNEGRGYVLRRLLRRALTRMHMFGVTEPFLAPAVDAVIATMSGRYPELLERAGIVKDIITAEEERFLATIEQGFGKLHEVIEKTKKTKSRTVAGRDVFLITIRMGSPSSSPKNSHWRSSSMQPPHPFSANWVCQAIADSRP